VTQFRDSEDRDNPPNVGHSTSNHLTQLLAQIHCIALKYYFIIGTQTTKRTFYNPSALYTFSQFMACMNHLNSKLEIPHYATSTSLYQSLSTSHSCIILLEFPFSPLFLSSFHRSLHSSGIAQLIRD